MKYVTIAVESQFKQLQSRSPEKLFFELLHNCLYCDSNSRSMKEIVKSFTMIYFSKCQEKIGDIFSIQTHTQRTFLVEVFKLPVIGFRMFQNE